MSDSPEESILTEVLTAAIGGAISASLLYPLEVIKTKMQAIDSTVAADSSSTNGGENGGTDGQHEEGDANGASSKRVNVRRMWQKSAICRTPFPAPTADQGMIAFAKYIYATEGGFSVFLRGMELSAFQSALEKAIYFFSYTALKQAYEKVSDGAQLTAATNLTLGYLADWSHLPITLPVDAWATEIKIRGNGRAPLTILLAMLSDKDRSFYKGLSAYYLLCLRPALQYTVYEQVKRAYLESKTRKSLSAQEAFLLGMVARTVAIVVVFPFLRAKVLLQTQQKHHEAGEESDGTLSVLRRQWEKEGWHGVFQGLVPEVTRGALSAALMLMIKERLTVTVHNLVAQK